MNGDLGKLPSGAVFTSSSATPDQTVVGVAAIPDCGSASAMVNGEVESGGGCYNSPPPPSLAGGASSPAANVTTAQDSSIPLDQLKQMLSSQLEYYFSRENLANDTYLLSQMDNDQYVPIWTVANFNQVKKLTKDINLITEVLRESPNVQVDEEGVKVRPNHKRCIVILREIPDNTPIEEVKNLFSGENCPRLISCEFALNSSWYVTFETDDDAQRAYRFLREEVREFQGKPITARIKAKPMHRMPLPPVASVKNGYRNTAPVAATYDPATVTYPTAQQRFVYTNGAPPQGGYGSQMHVYQYYAPNMLQAWPAAPAAPYYDIGSVFAVNGLSPQSSFKQVAGPRYQPRPRNKRNSVPLQGETRQHLQPPPPGSPQTRPPVKGTICVNAGQTQAASQESSDVVNAAVTNQNQGQSTIVRPDVDDGCSLQYRQSVGLSISNKETSSLIRHRPTRRRRDEELVPTSPQPPPSTLIKDPIGHRNNSAHFDLEASAFPPLPGIEISSGAVHTNIPKQTAPPVSETVAPSQVEVVQAQWGESRLADVVKGTARPKTSSTKDKEVIQSNETLPQVETSLLAGSSNIMSPVTGVECKDAATGSSDLSITLTNTVAMTPPFSPDKLVPLQTIKCTMADKSTKTDESLLNGDVCELACPTTTNAATMTVIVTTETTPRQTTVSMTTASAQRPQTPPQTSAQTNDNGPPRMSYAQVAQHHKERLMRERQNSTGEQPTKEKLAAQTIQSRVTQQDSREHKESRGNARRSAKSTRSNQANSHANLKIQTSPNRASSPNQSGENVLHQSSVQTDGIIDSNDTIQQRDGGQIRYSTGRGAGRTYDRVQGGGPGRRRSGIDQRPQFREFLGNRSPK